MRFLQSLAALSCILWSSFLHADEFRPLYRGARAMAMGNAFTAIADDEQAIFYNPAGLAGVRKFSINVAAVDMELTSQTLAEYPTLLGSLASPGISTLNTFMGKNIYAKGQGTATVLLPGFGIAGIYDAQVALREKNQSMPQIQIGAQTTYGGQIAFGVPIVKFRKRKGELRFGLGAKMMWRGGGYQTLTLTQLMALDVAGVSTRVTQTGIGYGADAGLQGVYNFKKKITFHAGLAMTNLGDMAFENGGDIQRSNLTLGVAARFKSSDMQATLAYDFSNIMDYLDWRKKMHLGLELAFPAVSLYAGLNQLNFTYGIGFDFWLLKITGLSYAEDQATLAGQDPERRYMVHLAFKFDLN